MIKTLVTTPMLPSDVLVQLDDSGELPAITVIASRPLSRREIALLHDLAGDHGATIEFRRAP